MRVVAYTSLYVPSGGSFAEDVDNIVAVSKRKNKERNITGLMFSHNGRFLQLLEGADAALTELLTKIENDSRHTELQYLFDDPIAVRGLASWNMDCFALGENEPIDVNAIRQVTESYRKIFKMNTPFLVDLIRDHSV